LHIMANSGWSWHLFAAPAIWIGRLRGKAVLVNYRGGEAASFLDHSFFTVKMSLRRAQVLAVPSQFLHQIFAGYGFAVRIVPNIIDLDRFTPASPAVDKIDPHIVVARNLEPIYDNATALRAFALVKREIPGARLTIAGSGPDLPMLNRLAQELGISNAVTFSGRLDNERMALLYRSARIVLNPSLADNMPNSILEALACGVPVISTSVGGVPFLVTHEKTALLVPVQDPQAILRVLNDSLLAQRLTVAGLSLAQEFSWPKVRESLFAAYHSAQETATPALKATP
jgi:L-malate glycosyltransferase